MTQTEKWMEIRARYFNKEISESEYWKLCDEAGLEMTAWIDEECAREGGFTGDSIDLVSFASDEEWIEKIN
ncbi:hypothetical protein LJB92_03695 [Bacteroidales bacterium OttesenSCG-928-M06]|nr:hypothetical protein [Bacteroidales bacterium OttesenSCG-928-M06]